MPSSTQNRFCTNISEHANNERRRPGPIRRCLTTHTIVTSSIHGSPWHSPSGCVEEIGAKMRAVTSTTEASRVAPVRSESIRHPVHACFLHSHSRAVVWLCMHACVHACMRACVHACAVRADSIAIVSVGAIFGIRWSTDSQHACVCVVQPCSLSLSLSLSALRGIIL